MLNSAGVPPQAPYPVRLSVDYAERQSRWKALFRVILALPALLLVLLFVYLLEFAVFVTWIVLLIRGRHAPWMFVFILGMLRVVTRVYAYFFLLTDTYVVFEGAHPLTLDVDYPERISRWQLVFWKYITSVPHLLAVQVLHAVALAFSFVGWLGIVFGGSYPKGLHAFATGVLRWQVRVTAYVLSLTDAFPPFSWAEDAGPGSRRSLLISAAVGAVAVAALVGAIVAAVLVGRGNETTFAVSYQDLVEGTHAPGENLVIGDGLAIDLAGATDPADPFAGFIVADAGERLLTFEVRITNNSKRDLSVERYDFGLVDSGGGDNSPIAVAVDNHRTPEEIKRGETATVDVVFEVGDDGPPRELSYHATRRALRTIVYKFR